MKLDSKFKTSGDAWNQNELEVFEQCADETVFIIDHTTQRLVTEDPASQAMLSLAAPVRSVSNQLNQVVVVKKGLIDIVSNGMMTALIGTKSSLKRCGGQGDVLCGILGTFSTYTTRNLSDAILASMTTRQASLHAFEQQGHCLVTPDIINQGITSVLSQIYRANL